MKKLVCFITMILIVIGLVGCKVDTPSTTQKKALSDARFNGNFVYSNYWKDSDGLEEKNEYYSYTFDGTNDCTLYYSYENYYKSSGWLTGKDYNYYKIEIDESKTYFRLCLATYNGSGYEPLGTWDDWKKYEFLDGGNTLRIWDFPEKYPDSYEDYIKK